MFNYLASKFVMNKVITNTDLELGQAIFKKVNE